MNICEFAPSLWCRFSFTDVLPYGYCDKQKGDWEGDAYIALHILLNNFKVNNLVKCIYSYQMRIFIMNVSYELQHSCI